MIKSRDEVEKEEEEGVNYDLILQSSTKSIVRFFCVSEQYDP